MTRSDVIAILILLSVIDTSTVMYGLWVGGVDVSAGLISVSEESRTQMDQIQCLVYV